MISIENDYSLTLPYCTDCFTETAHHDITESLDNECMAALTLLELSDAFGIINHRILRKHLEYSFTVTRSFLSWVQSYPGERIECVTVRRSTKKG